MAAIEKYQTSSGKTLYRVRYRTPEGKQTCKRGLRTKRDTQRFTASVEVSMMRGEYIAPSLGRVAVGELGQAWLDPKKQSSAPGHYRMLESAWKVHAHPRWARVALSDIDLLNVEAPISAFAHTESMRLDEIHKTLVKGHLVKH